MNPRRGGRPLAPEGAATRRPDAAPAPGRSGVDLRDLEREVAVSAVFDAQHAQLVRLARLLGADADAEDVVAEAFYDLYRRYDRLRDPSRATAYVRAAVCNLTRMRLRHLQVVRRHASLPNPDDGRLVGSAESELLLREEQQQVIDALATLPTRQRQALVLRYWLDLREAEVAETMGISKGSVKVHTSRGMAALTERLAEPRGARR